ncbi:MAG: hypothetical protein OXC62_09120 [Aestuariivita sp.]|nr:hypothetical protein [Aestuariivita sp.]
MIKILWVALMAIVLSACGGSNNSGKNMNPGTTPPNTPLTTQAQINAFASSGFNAQRMAEAAKENAEMVLENAKKAHDLLNAITTQGSSGMTERNAQDILDASDTITQAIETIDGHLEAIKESETELKALVVEGDNKDTRDIALAVIEDIIPIVEGYKKNIEEIRDDADGIMMFVKTVEGTDDTKLTPSDHAKMVAEALQGVLTGDNGTPLTLPNIETYPTDPDQSFAARGDNRPDGLRTFAEIFRSNVSMQPRLNANVPAISIEGMSFDEVHGDTSGGSFATNTAATTGNAVTHRGISGFIISRGDAPADAPSARTADYGKGWYFVPETPNTLYTSGSGDSFMQARFARYAVWLSGDDPEAPTLNIHRGPGDGSLALGSTADLTAPDTDADNPLPASATYSGTAGGLSTRLTDGKATSSGSFTADVKLTAKFADAPTIGGTINNFKGDAVNTAWSLTLPDATVFALATDTAGTFNVNGNTTGNFRINGYGMDSEKRPLGVHGDFSNNFSDGTVVGAFAAK